MPAEFTITQILGIEEDGEWTAYGCLLDGPGAPTDKGVRIGHRPGSDFDPPKVGDELYGEIKDRRDGSHYFKRAARERGGSSGGTDKFDRRPEHPENAARMRHTSCLSAAPAYIEQMLTVGVTEQPKTMDEYWALVATTIRNLLDTYPGAPEAPAQPELASNGASKADESVPF